MSAERELQDNGSYTGRHPTALTGPCNPSRPACVNKGAALGDPQPKGPPALFNRRLVSSFSAGESRHKSIQPVRGSPPVSLDRD